MSFWDSVPHPRFKPKEPERLQARRGEIDRPVPPSTKETAYERLRNLTQVLQQAKDGKLYLGHEEITRMREHINVIPFYLKWRKYCHHLCDVALETRPSPTTTPGKKRRRQRK